MNRSYLQSTLAAALLMMSCAGCEQNSEVAPASATQAADQLAPQQSFDLIVETFRRGVEDVPIGFVVHDSSGSQTMMTGRNEVSQQLVPPAKQGDPYKAVITVKSTSRYSLKKSTEEPGQPADQAAGATAAGAESTAQILDPDVVSNPSDRHVAADSNQVTVASKDDGYERTYELIYEKGRWKLVTELDPKTEGAIKFAFERALDSQS